MYCSKNLEIQAAKPGGEIFFQYKVVKCISIHRLSTEFSCIGQHSISET